MGVSSNFRVQNGITTTSVSNLIGLNVTDDNTISNTDISFSSNDLTINNKTTTGKIILKTNNTTALTINADGNVIFANGLTATIPATSISGIISVSQLGTGTANSTAYLRGDGTWQELSKSTIGLSNVENTALSTWTGSTNLTTAGALTATSLTVTGNLTVNGNTTTVNSTTMTVDDPILTLGGDSAPTTDDNKDRGIEFRWHNGTTSKVGFFGFDDSTGYLTFIPDATNTSEVFSGTLGDIQAANFRGNATTATALATPRTISTTGDVIWTSSAFDGSANATGSAALSTITQSTGSSFVKITLDTKGRVTGNTAVAQNDITGLLGANSLTETMIADGTILARVAANETISGTWSYNSGTLNLTNATSNVISFNTAGVFGPTFTNRSPGTKIVLYPSISASMVDYGFGVEGSTLWSSVPNTSHYFKWYGGQTLAATLTGAGALTTVGNINSSGLSTSWAVTSGTNTGAINATMGTSSAATWLLSGTSGGTFRYGIQGLDSGGHMRFYEGTNFMSWQSGQLNIPTANGTAPLLITSSTKVSNLNVDLLDGYHADTAYNSFGGSSIPVRHPAGYLFTNYFNMSANDVGNATPSRIAIETGSDGYLRWQTPGNFINGVSKGSVLREVQNGTMVAGNTYAVWTGGGAITMSMPSYVNTTWGDIIYIVNLRFGGSWAVNNFTITCDSSTRFAGQALAESLICDIDAGGFTLRCNWKDGSAAEWAII